MRGKKPSFNVRRQAHLIVLLESGENSTAELADVFGVGRSTGPWSAAAPPLRPDRPAPAPPVPVPAPLPDGRLVGGFSSSVGHPAFLVRFAVPASQL